MSGHPRPSGFTLIETLVAFAITAMTLSVLFQVNGTSTTTAAAAEDYVHATELARSLIAEHATTQRALAFSAGGVESDQFRWTIRGEGYQPAGMATGDGVFELRRITARVEWRSRNNARHVELDTVMPFFRERTQ